MEQPQNYIQEIKQILTHARQKAYSAVSSAMVEAYWLIGKRIVEEEQHGEKRAEYGKKIIVNLSTELTNDFGKGYSERTLREFSTILSNISRNINSANSVRQIVMVSFSKSYESF